MLFIIAVLCVLVVFCVGMIAAALVAHQKTREKLERAEQTIEAIIDSDVNARFVDAWAGMKISAPWGDNWEFPVSSNLILKAASRHEFIKVFKDHFEGRLLRE